MRRILVIEDNPSLREEICSSLRNEGYRVFEADNGSKGVDHAKLHHPDLILCDIMMPEMNGYEVLNELSHQSQTKIIPFIFITALDDRRHFRTGMEMGADDYLTKPFTIVELTTAVKTRLDKYFNFQVAYEIENIENNIKLKLRVLKKQIAENKSEIAEISKTNNSLNIELKTKQSELFEEVLKAVEIKNTLQILKNQLKQELRRVAISHEQKDMLIGLLNKIEKIGSKKDNWRFFQLKFNQVHPDFVTSINQKYPSLTQLDLTIMSAILFNLNSNMISNMLNISNDSLRKSKYRLKKKLMLGPEDNLIKFIHKMQPEKTKTN